MKEGHRFTGAIQQVKHRLKQEVGGKTWHIGRDFKHKTRNSLKLHETQDYNISLIVAGSLHNVCNNGEYMKAVHVFFSYP